MRRMELHAVVARRATHPAAFVALGGLLQHLGHAGLRARISVVTVGSADSGAPSAKASQSATHATNQKPIRRWLAPGLKRSSASRSSNSFACVAG